MIRLTAEEDALVREAAARENKLPAVWIRERALLATVDASGSGKEEIARQGP